VPTLAVPAPTQAGLPPTVSIAQAPVDLAMADLADLYARVSPGVVTIWVYDNAGGPNDSVTPLAQGSGFVLDGDGHIVTNEHVVEGASAIEVDFTDGRKAWAELLGTDLDSDLALLHVDLPGAALTPLPLGDSDEVRVGDLVVAIGNPFGLTGTLTLGVVSAIGRTLDSQRATPGGEGFYAAGDILQTDAALNPGNSGGPLLNMRGEVIGVNRAIRTEAFTVSGDAANSGVGFAIPINIVRRVAPELIADGSVDYPYLGVTSLNEETWNLRTVDPWPAVGRHRRVCDLRDARRAGGARRRRRRRALQRRRPGARRRPHRRHRRLADPDVLRSPGLPAQGDDDR
jgi:2-alkenal reductase